MKIKRQTPQRLRQKCLRGNPDGDITAIVEGRPNYITTHQISEGTHPSLALLIRDIAKQLHALPSACDDTTRLTNVFTGRPARVEHVARYCFAFRNKAASPPWFTTAMKSESLAVPAAWTARLCLQRTAWQRAEVASKPTLEERLLAAAGGTPNAFRDTFLNDFDPV
jgi:hypothetical protein